MHYHVTEYSSRQASSRTRAIFGSLTEADRYVETFVAEMESFIVVSDRPHGYRLTNEQGVDLGSIGVESCDDESGCLVTDLTYLDEDDEDEVAGDEEDEIAGAEEPGPASDEYVSMSEWIDEVGDADAVAARPGPEMLAAIPDWGWVVEVDYGGGWRRYGSYYTDKRMAKRHARELRSLGNADRVRVRHLRET